MNKTIPLISSGLTGPLGVLHLPRLWQKVSLEIAGKLNSDYPGIGGGYDSMVLDGLSLNKDAFVAFMQTKPTYNQLEAWVLEQSGGAIDAAAVSTLNDAITGYNHDDETRKEILSACGIADDSTILDAVNLNNLDDWQCFHSEEIA
ncbi:MAG: hypothetical protein ACJAR1_001969 [Rubritalea sp.]|jgi:hypothetical protein|tara:strand:- start:14948 stop:15385 length:438 start_codon:yes stop_codon:yes gene_type:complete